MRQAGCRHRTFLASLSDVTERAGCWDGQPGGAMQEIR